MDAAPGKSSTTNIARRGIISFVVITLVGVVIAAAVSAFVLGHDTLGEFHDGNDVRWDFLLVGGAFWFFAVTGIPYFIAFVVIVARYSARRRERQPTI
jgi:hypothetical protein